MFKRRDSEYVEFGIPCSDLDKSIEFFTQELDFRLTSIFPADNPRFAVVNGYGIGLRLEHTKSEVWSVCSSIRIIGSRADKFVSPDGIAVEFLDSEPTPIVPKPVLNDLMFNAGDNSDWVKGRAGMSYRDLIPDRLGGFLIASRIHISEAGPVADYVHFHHVRFQLIYCLKGWARLVYEDQGAPFVFESGDCVLQPPGIRHRVLETSGEFDVVEVSCPAEHETRVEHDMKLPNDTVDHERIFGDQKFVWSRASGAEWRKDRGAGFEVRETGIGEASGGQADVDLIRFSGTEAIEWDTSQASFLFVIEGDASIIHDNKRSELHSGDSALIPPGIKVNFEEWSEDLQILKVNFISDPANN